MSYDQGRTHGEGLEVDGLEIVYFLPQAVDKAPSNNSLSYTLFYGFNCTFKG